MHISDWFDINHIITKKALLEFEFKAFKHGFFISAEWLEKGTGNMPKIPDQEQSLFYQKMLREEATYDKFTSYVNLELRFEYLSHHYSYLLKQPFG